MNTDHISIAHSVTVHSVARSMGWQVGRENHFITPHVLQSTAAGTA